MNKVFWIAAIIVSICLYNGSVKLDQQEIRIKVLEQQLDSIQYQLSGDAYWLDTTIKHIRKTPMKPKEK